MHFSLEGLATKPSICMSNFQVSSLPSLLKCKTTPAFLKQSKHLVFLLRRNSRY
ncbi:hypothetical protein KSS87_010290 [Heliosperma pusillum]|nr:hypothetical protein KSS87_010290 [Heliosperma pusillum]